ncbi:hypothetical protein IT575_12250 [bacterium]|nr:hypothetical protein [bacterium]
MIKTLILFWADIWKQRNPFWKDDELWLSIALSIAGGVWHYCNQEMFEPLRVGLSDVLTVASILFGFVLSTLLFYIDAAGSWADKKPIRRVAAMLVDEQIWTVVTLLTTIAYVAVLKFTDLLYIHNLPIRSALHAALFFSLIYPGFQLLNHALTVRWVFKRASVLKGEAKMPSKRLTLFSADMADFEEVEPQQQAQDKAST